MTRPYYYYITDTGVVKILIPIVMSQEKKTEHDVVNCPGLLEQTSQSCGVCQAVVHPTSLMQQLGSLQSTPAVAMMRFSAQVFAATGMERKVWIWKPSEKSVLS